MSSTLLVERTPTGPQDERSTILRRRQAAKGRRSSAGGIRYKSRLNAVDDLPAPQQLGRSLSTEHRSQWGLAVERVGSLFAIHHVFEVLHMFT